MATYILPLTAPDATLDRVGGKAANLSRLARAGFAVPPGFIVTTDAYRRFVGANGIQPRILALAASVTADDLGALETVSAEIRALFAEGAAPPDLVAAITAAYRTLRVRAPGAAGLAVRSSATAEDLPGLAFAGQQDTYLNVIGERATLAAIRRCWGSLWTARAMAYRVRNHVPAAEVALAVLAQELIPAAVSGVLFTANPLTGRRDEIVIDASFGLGEAIVSGQVDPDHYVIDSRAWRITRRKLGAKALAVLPRADGGTEQVPRSAGQEQALPDPAILVLGRTAQNVAALFGAPQDIEWAWVDARFYLLQSRPITSLYPLPRRPEQAGRAAGPRLYVNFNAIQGVSDPLTPLGIDALRLTFGAAGALLRIRSAPRDFMPDAGGRLFLDLTDPVGDRRLRPLALAFLAHTDPAAQQILRRLIRERRFAPRAVLTPRRAAGLLLAALPLLRTAAAALWRPARFRARALARIEEFVAQTQAHARAAPDFAACLRAMERDLPRAESVSIRVMPGALPALAALPLVDRWLARWLGEKPGVAASLMRGAPGNTTVEMNLKLWAAAQQIRADGPAREWMRARPAPDLAAAYRQGAWPATARQALAAFLQVYGMRGVAEIDLGRPPWREDPTPIIQALCGYLDLEDPRLAPDFLFQRGAQEAERRAAEYIARVRKTRFGRLRAAALAATIGRMRMLSALREAPLFCLVRVNGIYRAALLASARRLVAAGALAAPDDIFFLSLTQLKQYARGQPIDLKTPAGANRAMYARERTRRAMPRLLLSTGEAFYEGMGAVATGGAVLTGEPVSPGVMEGRAHVILDPQHARLEAGEILVCPATDPGWTPLFLTAGGLVMEIGGLITHGSVVAREYGIPAVVGVHQATTRLKTGQRLRVDGSAGRVTILP
jgi:rifampicin phosphotransferase